MKRIVSDVVSLWYEKAEDRSEHFFEVRLHGVMRLRNDLLLNERLISHYLGQVGPVPFRPDFSFGGAIEERLFPHSNRFPINLTVAGEVVHRPYRDETVIPGTSHRTSMQKVEFVELANVDGQVGAIGWIGHHEYTRSIPTSLGIRGLRARLGDLQVGEANLFEDCFKEPRFNGWSIGEIHVFDRRIVPNARRDNFEVNHHYYNLLAQLGPIVGQIAQRCRSASVSRNAAQIVENVIAEISDRIKERRTFDRAELSRLRSSILRARMKLKGVSGPERRKRLGAKLERVHKTLVKHRPKAGASVVALDEAAALVSRLVTNRDQARRLVEELRRLCE